MLSLMIGDVVVVDATITCSGYFGPELVEENFHHDTFRMITILHLLEMVDGRTCSLSS